MKKYIILVLIFTTSISIAQTTAGEYSIKNIDINTEYSDFGTAFFGNDKVIFSSPRSKRSLTRSIWKPNSQPYLDLFIGSIGSDGQIIDKKKILGAANSKFHEAQVAFTKDLKTVYFTRNNYYDNTAKNDSKGVLKLQLFKASVGADGIWRTIIKLPFNNDQYSTGHPALSPDGKTLYFVSDRPESIGKSDIYSVEIQDNGSYSSPKNLGGGINTKDKEMFPFISHDNVLYFSSEGHSSKGGLDIFASKISDNTYSKALNLGTPINSMKDDFAYIINSKNTKGYFSSNRNKGKGDDDIYNFESTKPIKIECLQLVEGVLKDQNSQQIIAGSTINLIGKDGNELAKETTDNNGKFSFEIVCGTSYTIKGSKEGYQGGEKQITSTNSFNDEQITIALNLVPDVIEFKERKIDINPVYFDLNKANIRYDAAKELDKVVNIMKKNPTYIVESRSHTDSRGNDLHNLKLSDRRAKSSVDYIISKGIDAGRISGKGFGETRGLNTCHNNQPCKEAEHQINRRTEFFIVKE